MTTLVTEPPALTDPPGSAPVGSRPDRAQEVTLARGARWLTGGTLLVGVVNYAYAFALTRLLTPGNYAGFAAGQALLLTVGTVAAVSVPWVLAQQLLRADGDRDLRAAAVRFATLANVVQGAVAAVLVGLVASRFLSGVGAVAVAVGALLIFLASTSLGWFQGDQRFRAVALRGVGEVGGKAVAGLALVGLGAGAAGALAGFGVGAGLLLVVGTWLMRHDYRRAAGSADPQMWLSTRGVAGIQGLVSVLASVDVVLVAVLPVPAGEAASYQASMILARVPLFLAGAVAAVAFTLLGAAGGSPPTTGGPGGLLRTGSRLYLTVAIPLALVLATAPLPLLAPLFPASFGELHTLLRLTAVAGVLIGHVELLTTFFQAEGRYAASMRRQGVGVVLTLLAVPVGWHLGGTQGIALAACLGAATTLGLLVALGARTWPGSQRVGAGPVAAVVGLGLLLWALSPFPALWLVVATVVLAVAGHRVFLRPARRGRHWRTPRHRQVP